jgi:DNA recombination protein RmuC
MDTASLIAGLAAGAAAGGALAWLLRGAAAAKSAAALAAQHQAAADELRETIGALRAEASRAGVQADRATQLEADLEALRERLSAAGEANAGLQSTLEAERKAIAGQRALLAEDQARLIDSFKALSQDALKHNSAAFIELARENLGAFQQSAKGELEQRQQAIDALVKPLKEQLARYEEQIQAIEGTRRQDYGRLAEQLSTLGDKTGKLDLALRAPLSRGRWGEIQLQRVAEFSGMIEHCDFDVQVNAESEGGRVRPDMLVHLPAGAHFVIDAKTPLDAYLDAVEAPDEAGRKAALARHAAQVRSHMDQLSQKGYWTRFDRTPDFTILFLPGENFLSAAVENDPGLIEEGFRKKVLLASPTLLVAFLKTAALAWRQELLRENAEKISQLARELYERLATMGGHLADLGKAINKSVESYNKTIGSLERSVLPKARQFPELGVHPKETLPDEFPPVQAEIRGLNAPELSTPERFGAEETLSGRPDA